MIFVPLDVCLLAFLVMSVTLLVVYTVAILDAGVLISLFSQGGGGGALTV